MPKYTTVATRTASQLTSPNTLRLMREIVAPKPAGSRPIGRDTRKPDQQPTPYTYLDEFTELR
jgi:hypothetical protein